MSNSRVKISIQQLRPGMFVEKTYTDQGILLFSSNSLIANFHEIEVLRRQGVSVLEINARKGLIPPGVTVEPELEEPEHDFTLYTEQLREINEVRKGTINAVKIMMSAAKEDKFFTFTPLMNNLHKLISVITSVPDIALGLCQIKSSSDYLYSHSVNVSVMMMGLAHMLGYSKKMILDAGMAGLLHDIGAIKIPENILRKESRRTNFEMELYRKHPAFGLEIIKNYKTEFPERILETILSHHERINGGGFPNRLKGEMIDELALLCAVTDTFDRLTTSGIGRKACLPQEALALIFQGSDEEYPRQLVEYFTKLLGVYPVGSLVKLESGEMGIVVKINRDKLLYPQVLIVTDVNGSRLEKPQYRDLSSFTRDNYRELWKITASLDPRSYNIQPSDIILRYVA
ncbi:MAG: HD-GYP domain-containing protein [Fibrobacter sp.]|nr:HD-GYP domain-containing protein [Fibrobacter sp.]